MSSFFHQYSRRGRIPSRRANARSDKPLDAARLRTASAFPRVQFRRRLPAPLAAIRASDRSLPGGRGAGTGLHGLRSGGRAHTRAALPLAAYKKLYEVEGEIAAADHAEKLAARQARSRPVFEELVSWCKVYQPHEPPTSAMGAAIRYLLNHRLALGRFLGAGEVPVDNGIVERLHVRAALTRKNFLFAGSDAGGERAAIAFTILGCCRLVGVNPVNYLADVLPRLSRRVRIRTLPDLLPAAWRAARD